MEREKLAGQQKGEEEAGWVTLRNNKRSPKKQISPSKPQHIPIVVNLETVEAKPLRKEESVLEKLERYEEEKEQERILDVQARIAKRDRENKSPGKPGSKVLIMRGQRRVRRWYWKAPQNIVLESPEQGSRRVRQCLHRSI